jgi:hypothetical protein
VPTTMSSAANLAIETFLPADAESAVAGEIAEPAQGCSSGGFSSSFFSSSFSSSSRGTSFCSAAPRKTVANRSLKPPRKAAKP